MARNERAWITWDGTHWVHRYNDYVFASYRAGDHSPRVLDAETRKFFLWNFVPSSGDTIVDIGAGIGTEAPTFSAFVGDTGRVIAVEAHPTVHSTLVTNVEANGLINVETQQMAIAAHSGHITITDDLATHDANTTMADSGEGIDVPCDTLDALIERIDVEDIALLKMNIEGAELDALESGTHALSITRNVCVSCHDFIADRTGNEMFRTKERVQVLLRSAGFTLRTNPDATTPWGRDYIYGSR